MIRHSGISPLGRAGPHRAPARPNFLGPDNAPNDGFVSPFGINVFRSRETTKCIDEQQLWHLNMNIIERMGLRLLRSVERTWRVHVRGRPSAGRDELARLGLVTVDAKPGCDELSRFALRSVGEVTRKETGPFARDV